MAGIKDKKEVIKIKIYPSKHKIKTISNKNIDTDLNIPLAYITLDHSKYEINKNISEDFMVSTKDPIIPETEINNINSKLFNDFGEEGIMEDLIKRVGEKYYYSPAEMRTFYPKSFYYKVLAKKNMQYKASKSYNINIACIDDPDSLDLTKRLETIFSVPGRRGKIPSNIKINDNSLSDVVLNTGSLNKTDFIFIESPDSIYYDEGHTQEIDYDSFNSNHTNVWISCDRHPYYSMQDLGIETKFKLKFPLLTTEDEVESKVSFNSASMIAPGTIIHNIFVGTSTPVLIIENEGSSFHIISHSSILENPEKNRNLIYEVMMYVYLKSYKESEPQKEWISYEVPDYEMSSNKLVKKTRFISSANINTLLNLGSNDYTIRRLMISEDSNNRQATRDVDLSDPSEGIKVLEITHGHIVFGLDKSQITSDYSEPTKPTGWISIYANNKIYYIKKNYYSIETNIEDNIFIEETEDFIKLKIYPFKSSKHGIDLKYDYELNLPLIKTENEFLSKVRNIVYTVYIKNGIIRYIEADKYDEKDELSTILLTIEVKQTNDSINIFDMRQLGGGLPEDLPDNYNLLDIGHINGRPYRKGSTIVITMPKRYEKYKREIVEAAEEYKIAEDFIITFFEDKKEE